MTRTDHASSVEPGATVKGADSDRPNRHTLYTAQERVRRDESVWTIVQGVLAPVQFVVFLVSLGLVLRTLATGEGAFAADISIVVKTLVLYTIMITGSIWEKVVFGKWLFAPAFFWEDMVSMLVLALHTLYLVMLCGEIGTLEQRMLVALAGYGSYVVNAAQFLWKLRMARLQGATLPQAVTA
jgi:3-vinyl bacteriochlorophyllide hydratase